MSEDSRNVVRCGRCQLNQYITRSGFCRKCGGALIVASTLESASESASKGIGEAEAWGKRLRRLRTERRLSQQALARIMDAPRTFISKLESRAKLPNFATVLSLMVALDVPLALLGEDMEARRSLFEALLLDCELVQLMREAGSDKLTCEQMEITLHVARSLVTGRYPFMEYMAV